MSWVNLVRQFFNTGPLLNYDRFTSPLPKKNIREYTADDYEACSELYRLTDNGRFPDGYLPIFQEYLSDGNTLILVIEDHGKIVGTGGIALSTLSDELTYAHLAFGLIHPDYQRQGLGTLLFCARLAYLSASRHWMIGITSAGTGTEEFYQKLGFSFISRVEDLKGVFLDNYEVKALGRDIARLKTLVIHSGSVSELNFNKALPNKDCREEYEAQQLHDYYEFCPQQDINYQE